MANILVVYYSSYGHIEIMARAQAEGAARVPGTQVVVKRVPELTPRDVAAAAGFRPAPRRGYSRINSFGCQSSWSLQRGH